jgi:hypothetical protein
LSIFFYLTSYDLNLFDNAELIDWVRSFVDNEFICYSIFVFLSPNDIYFWNLSSLSDFLEDCFFSSWFSFFTDAFEDILPLGDVIFEDLILSYETLAG